MKTNTKKSFKMKDVVCLVRAVLIFFVCQVSLIFFGMEVTFFLFESVLSTYFTSPF